MSSPFPGRHSPGPRHATLAPVRLPNVYWLAGSAALTSLSWIFYYKAIKLGDASTVALIGKGSVVTPYCWPSSSSEPLTLNKCAGAGLMVAGLILIARSP